MDGNPLAAWGTYGAEPGQFNMPWSVAVDSDGAVYVSDWRNDRIQKFEADGRFVAEFDGKKRRRRVRATPTDWPWTEDASTCAIGGTIECRCWTQTDE